MKLYNADASPNAFRVRVVIEELGLKVEYIDTPLKFDAPKPPGFLEASPHSKVPAFVDDDGFSLFESRAINTYLASKKPERGLYPDAPKRRALVEQWSYWQAIHLGPAMQAVSFERVVKEKFNMGSPDEDTIKAKLAEVDRYMPALEKGLAGKEWLVDTLTLADFAAASTFQLRKPAGISIEKYPNVTKWIERVEALPSWQRALPKYIKEMKL
jgi:glutathione S-transferase